MGQVSSGPTKCVHNTTTNDVKTADYCRSPSDCQHVLIARLCFGACPPHTHTHLNQALHFPTVFYLVQTHTHSLSSVCAHVCVISVFTEVVTVHLSAHGTLFVTDSSQRCAVYVPLTQRTLMLFAQFLIFSALTTPTNLQWDCT